MIRLSRFFIALCLSIALLVSSLFLATHSSNAQVNNAETVKDDLHLLKLAGHHAIFRHAIAPGSGDPQEVVMGDCSTQRNLDVTGREQAARIGEAFRQEGITPTQILSSGWCRCIDTAELMALGPVTDFEPLHSVWTQSADVAQRRTADMKKMLRALPQDETVVMVTHSTNLSALIGYGAPSGGGYVIKVDNNGELSVVGSIAPR